MVARPNDPAQTPCQDGLLTLEEQQQALTYLDACLAYDWHDPNEIGPDWKEIGEFLGRFVATQRWNRH